MIKEEFRTWIEISQKAVKNNYQRFRSLIDPACRLMAVVKSNAYGHGLIEFSKLVDQLGVDWFGVDSLVEAQAVRRSNVKKPILVFGYTLPLKLREATFDDISLTVADFQTLKYLKTLKARKKLKSILKLILVYIAKVFF
jgi:alanine racemase